MTDRAHGEPDPNRPRYLPEFFNEITLGQLVMVASMLLTLGITYQKIVGTIDLLEQQIASQQEMNLLRIATQNERLGKVETDMERVHVKLDALLQSVQRLSNRETN